MSKLIPVALRETSQHELPVSKATSPATYDIYPTHPLGDGLIFEGYDTLAAALASYHCIRIEGYVGIRFDQVKDRLTAAFTKQGVVPTWVQVERALKPEVCIDALIAPYLGGDDPIFGRVAHALALQDFFEQDQLDSLAADRADGPVIYYGIGASLVPVEGKLVFFEISKNEIQFRSRAGAVRNLGASQADDPKTMYKRFYFVDWIVLNKHKNALKNDIDFLVDGQRTEEITWMRGDAWRESIKRIVTSPIRVRPWFEPGAWGGQWIKNNIEGLEEDVVNYAWSFELIVPENGILLESAGLMLEHSFDFLMFHAGDAILGKDFSTYRYEFPIRFDFLDTFDGGNLSVQCHPHQAYIHQHFGEKITQEETYYILDCKDEAEVYLGFQEGITPAVFKEALETSQREKQELDIKQFIQTFKSHKHDLFLIPPGTIHSSGKDNLVLEISATPYIYTFKMYDWLRLDLEGNPRPLNIERGMENLVFERSGTRVASELIAKPHLVERTPEWELQHLATHPAHLYDVHRFYLKTEVQVRTHNQAHVLSLVEGQKIAVVTKNGTTTFSYAETFIIPAATEVYTLKNLSKDPVLVVKAFSK
ncbi:Mannose-6-phosphate isomerase, class I [Catalinimonas alkaloidigena]|uniref:Mannose-6-phosphate isomerase, class I n=1 Tax=Catalinimonas alkaloidigena TaxID=1075417 RepID=A0A1G9TQ71_9BACT|nr:class I mannose-6-phosphate isomerase [Catalinimonas alkaloidigena]SDM49564.1 Mannose-6-phosphate isomerase, class I [Catalinimonas alkaloidigena]